MDTQSTASLHFTYEDAAWLYLERSTWPVTPMLLFNTTAWLEANPAEFLKIINNIGPVKTWTGIDDGKTQDQ